MLSTKVRPASSPSRTVHGMRTAWLLMVMPRSRSMSMRSRYCARALRSSTTPVSCSIRSARVDLPWSMWAMMQKLRMIAGSVCPGWGRGRQALRQRSALVEWSGTGPGGRLDGPGDRSSLPQPGWLDRSHAPRPRPGRRRPRAARPDRPTPPLGAPAPTGAARGRAPAGQPGPRRHLAGLRLHPRVRLPTGRARRTAAVPQGGQPDGPAGFRRGVRPGGAGAPQPAVPASPPPGCCGRGTTWRAGRSWRSRTSRAAHPTGPGRPRT